MGFCSTHPFPPQPPAEPVQLHAHVLVGNWNMQCHAWPRELERTHAAMWHLHTATRGPGELEHSHVAHAHSRAWPRRAGVHAHSHEAWEDVSSSLSGPHATIWPLPWLWDSHSAGEGPGTCWGEESGGGIRRQPKRGEQREGHRCSARRREASGAARAAPRRREISCAGGSRGGWISSSVLPPRRGPGQTPLTVPAGLGVQCPTPSPARSHTEPQAPVTAALAPSRQLRHC